MTQRRYASLIGPLLGLYYPLPDGTEIEQRLMMNTSRLANLWCGLYTDDQVNRAIVEHGGMKLPDCFARHLDYDVFEVEKGCQGARRS